MTNKELLKFITKASEAKWEYLILSGKGLTSLPSEIEQLTSLHSLYVNNNQLTTLPKEIGQLTNLRTLYLNDNRINSLPQDIENLVGLSSLHLSNNGIKSFPKEIIYLKGLKSLYLDENRIRSFPDGLNKLTSLDSLYLRNNEIAGLPKNIFQLEKLKSFYIDGNFLSGLTEEVGKLVELKYLGLSYNKLAVLPPEIGALVNLNTLNLESNILDDLPPEIGQLSNLQELNLKSNSLLSLPPEIREKGCREIVRFYRQKLNQETDKIYEAKLIIIGESGAGKTSLGKKIQDSGYCLQEEDSTKGIDVIQWQFPLGNNREFRVNIWDFGGQEIYHTTHQFFLTKRSLYALVVDTRKEDTDFYYWLNVVELLSDKSPLLIVKNEKQNRQKEINERQLRGEFSNLKEISATNLANNRGLSEIMAQIKQYISALPHVGTELPKTWVKVREMLEKESRNHIRLDEYLKICEDNGFTRREDKLQLSGYLHDLGVCLHFQEDELLIKTVILKPTWGTDAVYKVLDNARVIESQGKFTNEDLKNIWYEEKYATMQSELLRLMMNFKLCYEIPNSPKNYIAPQLLTSNQPYYVWDERDNLMLRYEYEFMPKGILTRFIVEMHTWIEEQSYVWKSGVILNKDDSRAEVTELYRYHKGEIRIRVYGNQPRDLLASIRHEFGKIHDSYNSINDRINKIQRLKYKTLVPCNCITCKPSHIPYFYQLEILHNFKNKGIRNIQCQLSGDMVQVSRLIDDVKPKKSQNNFTQLHQSGNSKKPTEAEWNLRIEKLEKLRRRLAIETDPNILFKLEKDIETEEDKIATIENRLDEMS
jgi:internalin A